MGLRADVADYAAPTADARASAGAVADARAAAGAGPVTEAAPHLADAVGRAQHGDAEAFRLLYRDIQPRLLRYLHALAGQDAEDIASETWLQVTRDLPGFTGTYDGFRGWVATIARHRALDHLRRTTRRPPALALPAEDLAARPAAADTAQTALDAVATRNAVALIATLPPDQAEAVLLRAVLGLDAATAGHILGKRPGAIRTAAHRGLKTLHKKLARAREAQPAGVAQPARAAQPAGTALNGLAMNVAIRSRWRAISCTADLSRNDRSAVWTRPECARLISN
jgi:RNA polymerase sigma-70 factor (ECF subfamily)